MTIEDPTVQDLRLIADRTHLQGVSDEWLASMASIISRTLEAHRVIDGLDDSRPTDVSDRDRGNAPEDDENPHRGWVWKAAIEPTGAGVLDGKSVAIKDNVQVAGVPMRVGTNMLAGFIPDEDATFVSRVLGAGGSVKGKSACEYLSFSGSSFTTDTGAILNPHDTTRSAGGSSSGAGALVASGQVDIASGGDQSGSIRIPASFCGVYGIKPSYGLVPATGVAPIENTVDHIGALAATVEDLARFLDAVAGEDPEDPRQKVGWEAVSRPVLNGIFTEDLSGLRIGIVEESFAWDVSDPAVDTLVETSAWEFQQLGAVVGRVSIPMHRIGMHINTAIQMEGANTTMLRGNLAGSGWKGRYPRRLMEALGVARAKHSNDMSDMMKELALLGEYLTDRFHGSYYAKAQNFAPQLTAAYAKAFETYDLLVMPSTPMTATPLPGDDVSTEERFDYLLNMVNNTSPACVTGHPSLSLPCGKSNGLPVGLMLTGRHWQDATVLNAAHAFEKTGIYGDVVVKTPAIAR